MKKYLLIVCIILAILLTLLVVPPLISAPSWELVFLGVVLVIFLPVVIYYLLKKAFKP